MKEFSPIEWKNYHLHVLDQTLLLFKKRRSSAGLIRMWPRV